MFDRRHLNALCRGTARLAGLVAASALAVGLAATAYGAGTHTLAIGAVILSKNVCRFDTAGPTGLAFGSINPSSTTNATATANIGFNCTGSAATAVYTVTSNNGLHAAGPGAPQMQHAANTTQFLKYSLNTPISGTAPKNTAQNLAVTGTILVSDFQNAIAGSYADTVVLTIAP